MDLITGRQYERVTVEDPAAWAAAHVGGPCATDPVVVRTVCGSSVQSYFRSLLRPYDTAGYTSVLAFEFRKQYSILPTDSLIRFSEVLDEKQIAHYIERGFGIGTWILWILFPEPVGIAVARGLAKTFMRSAETGDYWTTVC